MTSTKLLTITLQDWAEVFMARSMHEWMLYVKASELSMPQFSVLMRLHYRGSCGLSELTEHMAVTAAAASQLVDGLVQKHLLERVENPADRRAKQISLSPKGRTLIEKGIERRNQWTTELGQYLTAEQQAMVIAGLNYLTAAARQLEKPPGP